MVHKWFPDKDKQGYFRQLESGIGKKITILGQKVTILEEIILYR